MPRSVEGRRGAAVSSPASVAALPSTPRDALPPGASSCSPEAPRRCSPRAASRQRRRRDRATPAPATTRSALRFTNSPLFVPGESRLAVSLVDRRRPCSATDRRLLPGAIVDAAGHAGRRLELTAPRAATASPRPTGRSASPSPTPASTSSCVEARRRVGQRSGCSTRRRCVPHIGSALPRSTHRRSTTTAVSSRTARSRPTRARCTTSRSPMRCTSGRRR